MNSVKSYICFPSIEKALNLEQPGRVIVEILMTFTRVHFVELVLLTHIPEQTIKIKPIKANWLTTFISLQLLAILRPVSADKLHEMKSSLVFYGFLLLPRLWCEFYGLCMTA